MVTVHQTEIEGTVVARYECESCHVARDAAVETYGLGKKVLGDREDSEEAAERDAVERAEDTLMFVPCPSCGHRQSGRAEVVAKTVTLYASIAAGGTVASGMYLQLEGVQDEELLWMTLGIGGFLLVFCTGALLAWSRHPWVRAVERTHFVDDEAVVASKGTQEQRRQEQAEAATLRRRVLVAAAVALSVGAAVAVVQMLERGGEGVRAMAPAPTSAGSSTTAAEEAAPTGPSAEALAHPLRHQLEVEGRRVDVVEGWVDVGDRRSEHVRIPKLWSRIGEDVSFVYDPALTVIERQRAIVLYGDEGMATIRVLDDPPEDVAAVDEVADGAEDDPTEEIRATLGNAERVGRRTKGRRGDRLDRFLFDLDHAATVEVDLRRTRADAPLLEAALASLTTRPRDRRPRYLVVVGERLELFEGETVVLRSGLEATLRLRERVWRLVDGLRLEHPADVAVMTRAHPDEGNEILFERAGVELVIAKRPEVPTPEAALAWLASVAGEDAEPFETELGGERHAGLRVKRDDEVLVAFGLPARQGGLAVLLRHPPGRAEDAQALAASVVTPRIR